MNSINAAHAHYINAAQRCASAPCTTQYQNPKFADKTSRCWRSCACITDESVKCGALE